MDYTQRHQAAMDAVRKDFDENEDEVLKIPNFTLMERFLVVGGKDPWLFYNNMLKIVYPANKKKSRNAIADLRDELELRRQNFEFQEEAEGLYGIMKHNNDEDFNVNGNWFHRTKENIGALKLPSSTEELFAVTKVVHLHFFNSLIQANIRKEAENIPLPAFEFWTDKKIKNLFEDEVNKFLWSNLNSDIEGCEHGMIPLLVALIKVKKHIDLLPQRLKKEEIYDTKLKDFVKMPEEKQRQILISEQEKILDFLMLKDPFIMRLARIESEREELIVEPHMYRDRKNIMRTYKGFQILIERKFEIFMNLILFRNIISTVWTEEFSQEVLICLVRAGMVLTNIRIWRDFIISRDSEFEQSGSLSTIQLSQPRTISSGKNKCRRQIVKIKKTKDVKKDPVKTPTVESKKEESKKEEMNWDSDETVSEENVDINLDTPAKSYSNYPIVDSSKDMGSAKDFVSSEVASENIPRLSSIMDICNKTQEIIYVSSDSESDVAERKKDKELLWKFRPPKKCSKYIPEEVPERQEIGWLSRRQIPSKSVPTSAIESFDESMSSTEPCFLQGGNERFSQGMLSSTNYIAKHPSNRSNSSQTISSSSYGLNTEPAKEMPSKGMSLRPRLVLNTLSKSQFFYLESIKVLLYNLYWFSLKELFFLMCTYLLYIYIYFFFVFIFIFFCGILLLSSFLFLIFVRKTKN